MTAVQTVEQLEELLSEPGEAVVESMRRLSGDIILLGAAGKIGPSLARMARRASDLAGGSRRIMAVSRFSDPNEETRLQQHGIETIRCDLLDADAVARLPDAPNVVYLVGLKFGTAQNPAPTWATNTLAAARVCERYPRSRIVALSTGNVYPMSEISRGGSVETDPLTPLGEYANAAVGRERIFEFYSQRHATPVALLRLFYATELRYGVLADIARKILAGEPVTLANGCFNCIWQGDANEMILRALSLAASPANAWNLCRPEIFSVREIATQLGALLGRRPHFTGTESATALLGNASRLCSVLGTPSTPVEKMLGWTAHWVKLGGRDLGKPTHFEVRDGNY